jgi:hypothetical protein
MLNLSYLSTQFTLLRLRDLKRNLAVSLNLVSYPFVGCRHLISVDSNFLARLIEAEGVLGLNSIDIDLQVDFLSHQEINILRRDPWALLRLGRSNIITRTSFVMATSWQEWASGMLTPVLACSILLVAKVISYIQGLGIDKELLIAISRAFLQLLVIGFVLEFIFKQIIE